jgi:hypothetical protein
MTNVPQNSEVLRSENELKFHYNITNFRNRLKGVPNLRIQLSNIKSNTKRTAYISLYSVA